MSSRPTATCATAAVGRVLGPGAEHQHVLAGIQRAAPAGAAQMREHDRHGAPDRGQPGDARLLREMFDDRCALDGDDARGKHDGWSGISRSMRSTSSCSISAWSMQRTGRGPPARAAAPRLPSACSRGRTTRRWRRRLAGRRAGLPHQGRDRDPRLMRSLRYADRAQHHGRGAVRGEGARRGHAQLHRRRRRACTESLRRPSRSSTSPRKPSRAGRLEDAGVDECRDVFQMLDTGACAQS